MSPPNDLETDWIGPASGDWADPANWSNGAPTGPGSAAVLGGTAAYDATIAAAADFTPDSVLVNDAAATLTIEGTLAAAATTLQAGLIVDAGLLAGPVTVSGGVLEITGAGPFALDPGITLDGGLQTWLNSQGGTAEVTLAAGQVFTGSGGLIDATEYQAANGGLPNADAPVSLTNLGTIQSSIGGELFLETTALANAGVIRSQSGYLLIDGQSFDNQAGAALLGSDATVGIFDGFTNEGLISVSGGTLEILSQAGFSNTGTIIADAATVLLGGDETVAGIGDLILSGGATLELDGTLENAGNTLAGSASPFHGAVLQNGTIVGGTLDPTSLALVFVPYAQNVLDDVTIEGGLDIGAGNVTLSNGTAVYTDASLQTLSALAVGAGATLVLAETSPTTIAQDISVAARGTVELTGPFTLTGTIAETGGQIALGAPYAPSPDQWTNQGTVLLDGGSLQLAGDETVARIGSIANTGGTISYTGGTLENAGATLDATATSLHGLVLAGGTIEAGTLDPTSLGIGFSAAYGFSQSDLDNVTVIRNLTLTGQLSLTGSTEIFADALATIPGTISVQGGYAGAGNLDLVGPGQLTLDENIVLLQGQLAWAASIGSTLATSTAAVTIASGISLSGYGLVSGSGEYQASTLDLTNDGTILADTDGGYRLSIDAASLVNDGLLEATTGAVLALGFTNPVTDPSSGVTTSVTTRFVNTGTMQILGGTVDLTVDATAAQLGHIVNSGGTLSYIGGTLDNTASLLGAGDTSLIGINFSGGTIEGGTLDTAGLGISFGLGYTQFGTPSVLDNVAVIGGLTVNGPVALSGSTTVTTDATQATLATIAVAAEGALIFLAPGPATLLNDVTLAGGSLGWTPVLGYNVTPPTQAVTIAAATLVSGSGDITGSLANVNDLLDLTVLGTIEADTANRTLQIQAASIDNAGLLLASNAAILIVGTLDDVYDPATNAYTLIASALTNTGTIQVQGATLELEVDATAARLGTIVNDAGTIIYAGGTLDNTGQTLGADSTSLIGLQLDGGTIEGGTLDTTGLGFGVTYAAGTYTPSDLDNVAIVDDLTVNGRVQLSGTTAIYADASATTPGTIIVGGEVDFVGAAQLTLADQVVLQGGNLTWLLSTQNQPTTVVAAATIAIGVEVSGGGQLGAATYDNDVTLTNLGTIAATLPTQAMTIAASTIVNDGLILVSADATLVLGTAMYVYDPVQQTDDQVGSQFVNAGTILSLGGTILLQVDASVAQLGTILNDGGVIRDTGGTLDNTGATLDAASDLVGLQLVGGTIEGGVIDAAALQLTSQFGDLSDVALVNGFTLDGGQITLDNATAVYASNALTAPGEILVENASLLFAGDTPFSFANTAILDGGTLAWADRVSGASGGTAEVTLTDAALIQGAGTIENPTYPSSTVDAITNNGLVIANAAYSVLAIDVGTLVNEGTLAAANTGILSIDDLVSASWTNDVAGRITGNNKTNLILGGSFDNAGEIDTNSGTIFINGETYDNFYIPGFTTWTNTGTISVVNGTLDLAGDETVADIGAIEGANATLRYQAGTLSNIGGTLDGGATSLIGIEFAGGTIEGGVVDQQALQLSFDIGSSDLDNVALIGDLVAAGGGTVRLTGSSAVFTDASETTPGSITILGSTVVFAQQASMTLVNSVSIARGELAFIGVGGTADVTVAATALIAGSGLVVNSPTVTGEPGLTTNLGIIEADDPTAQLSIETTSFSNAGVLAANSGATLVVAPVTFDNLAGGVLTGGSYQIGAGSTISFADLLTVDSASIDYEAANASLVAGTVSIDQTLGSITATGTLSLGSGSVFDQSILLTDSGSLLLQGGSHGGSLMVTAGGGVTGFGTLAGATLQSGGALHARTATLDVTAALTGAGTADIGPLATLALDAAASVNVTFLPGGGTLALADGASLFTGTVGGFAAGDTIALTNFTGSAAQVDGNVLTVTGASGTATIALSGGIGAGTLQVGTDPSGDTLVSLSATPAITIAAPASIPGTSVTGVAVSGIGVADTAGGTISVTLSDSTGAVDLFPASPSAAVITSTGMQAVTVTGSVADVNADLAGLVVNQFGNAAGRLVITATDSSGNVAASQLTVGASTAITVDGPYNYEGAVGQLADLPGIVIVDPAASSVTVTVSDVSGTLSSTAVSGATVAGAGTGTLTLGGSVAAVNAELAQLNYSGTPGSDTITVSATDSQGGTGQFTIAETPVPAPQLFVSTPQAATPGVATPFTDLAVQPGGDLSDATPMTLTITDTTGLLSAFQAMGTVTGSGTNSITMTGLASDINADLELLTFTGGQSGSTAATLDTLTFTASEYGVSTTGTVAVANPLTGTAGPISYLAPEVVLDNAVTGSLASTVGAEYVGSDGNTIETASNLVGTFVLPAPGDGVPLTEQVALAVYNPNATAIFVNVENQFATTGASFNGGRPVEVDAGQTVYIGTAGIASASDRESLLVTSTTLSGQVLSDRLVVIDPPDAVVNCKDGSDEPPKDGNDENQKNKPNQTPEELAKQAADELTKKGQKLPTGPDTSKPFLPELDINFNVSQVVQDLNAQTGGLLGAAAITVITVAAVAAIIATLPEDLLIGAGAALIAGARAAAAVIGPAIFAAASAAPAGAANATPSPPGGGAGAACMIPPPATPPPAGGSAGAAHGDVHLTTFDGVYYNFQAAGEFILAQSTVANDPFQVQIRLQPWFNGATVSVITAAAVKVGTDTVQFQAGSSTPLVDGVARTLAIGGPAIALSGGTLQRLSNTTFEIHLVGGEAVTITDAGGFLDVDPTLPTNAAAGSVKGLLGTDSGNQANEFMLPDGTILKQPLSFADLYTTFANAWRVTGTAGNSLFTYADGQSPDTFNDPGFPANAISLANLPAALVANAEALVAAAGITDPGIAQGAIQDYLLTGDPGFIASAAQQQTVAGTQALTAAAVSQAAVAGVGVAADAPVVTEAASGATAVVFDLYRIGDASLAGTVNYTVITPKAGYLDASSFAGDALPSGQASFAAGATSASVTIDIAGGIGAVPSAMLGLQIDTGSSGIAVIAPTATTTVVNATPTPGTPAVAAFVDAGTIGTLSGSGNAYTLDLGTVALNASLGVLVLGLVDQADPNADSLAGTLTATGNETVNLLNVASGITLAAAQQVQLPAAIDTTVAGAISETITFLGTDINASGYAGTPTATTLTITGEVACFAEGTAIRTPSGQTPVQTLRVGDLVSTTLGPRPVKWIGRRRIDLSRHANPLAAQPVRIARGALADAIPSRDLLLSPDHALFLDGVLVPAKVLVNDATIASLDLAEVTYFHIELQTHGVIFAEDAAVESYLDAGNRDSFENGQVVVRLHPEFARSRRDVQSVAVLCEAGAAVEAIRRRLLDRAAIATSAEPYLRVEPHAQGCTIRSRSFVPGHLTPDPHDRRRLGVKIAAILVAGQPIALDHPALVQGWHDVEPDGRWTDGAAQIPAALLRSGQPVELRLAAVGAYRSG